MRIGIGIAAGTVGFIMYGALYFFALSALHDDPDVAMRLTLAGMFFSGVCFLAGFRVLEDEGLPLFAKALALPLGGVVALAIGMLAITVISSNVLEIVLGLFVGISVGIFQFVDSLFAGAPFWF